MQPPPNEARVLVRRADDHVCATHSDMVKVLETLSVNLKWHTTIGYAVFSCGLAVVVMTIYSIFFAGALQSQVIANSKELEILERKVDQTMSYIDRKIDRHIDTEHHEMKAH